MRKKVEMNGIVMSIMNTGAEQRLNNRCKSASGLPCIIFYGIDCAPPTHLQCLNGISISKKLVRIILTHNVVCYVVEIILKLNTILSAYTTVFVNSFRQYLTNEGKQTSFYLH
jgi:hypothetical protein